MRRSVSPYTNPRCDPAECAVTCAVSMTRSTYSQHPGQVRPNRETCAPEAEIGKPYVRPRSSFVSELSEAESITVSMGGTLAPTPAPGGYGGTDIGAAAVLAQASVAPPPPPETFGAYTKKGESGTGVIAMIDLLVADLDKEMQEAEVMETDSQKEYEEMMSDSAAKRAQDSKSLTDKASAKAAEEEELQAETDTKAGTSKELAMTLQYIGELHGECDWLVKYYDVRKSARAGEVEALGKAKAVLNGADYSLVQVKQGSNVRVRSF